MAEYSQLGELLVTNKVITQDQLDIALGRQKKSNLRIGEELIRSGLVSEEKILITLAQAINLPFIKIKTMSIDPDLITRISSRVVTHFNFMPLEEKENVLHIAISDPLDLYKIDEIKLMLKKEINISLATSYEITEAINKYYGVGAKTISQMADESPAIEIRTQKLDGQVEKADGAEDPSVIKFIDQIIQQAIQDRATDIHIEPYENNLRVRCRIDGLLYDIPVPTTIHHFQSAIIIRLKIMADLDIAEKRLPQDGRIQVRIKGEDFDLRISILPTAYGESIEIRILARKQIFFSLEELGLDNQGLALLNTMIKLPHGIILVT
ncbi:MAG: ATPase, T2SS/T4P/T4SS family, partial [Patescibacteria group bacterium]